MRSVYIKIALLFLRMVDANKFRYSEMFKYYIFELEKYGEGRYDN
jgi:hypothetical protein